MREAIAAKVQSAFERIACATPRQWLYLFEDGGVVFSESSNRFAGLGASGVAAYLALDGGASLADLRHSFCGDLANAAASTNLEAIFALTRGIFPRDESDSEIWPEPDLSGNISKSPSSSRVHLHGISMQVDFPAGIGGELCRDCFRGSQACAEPVRWRIAAQQKNACWVIFLNGQELFSLADERQMGLGMLHAARSLVYTEGQYDVGFHAGMVAGDDFSLMLCAPREAGKSTLAAYLVAQGYDLIADEPALLDLASGAVAPLRLPISLKEGSWTVLEEQWPQLASAPVHLRSDGRRIRLLHPGNISWRQRQATQIVFPRYKPDVAPEFEFLSPLQTLQLLHEGGMLLAKSFSRERFESLLEWLVRIPGYRMQYASLEEAQLMLEKSSDATGNSR